MKKQSPLRKPNRFVIGASIIILLILVVVAFMKRTSDQMTTMRTTTIPSVVKKVDPGVTVKSVNNLKEVSGMYQFELELDIRGQAQKFTSYITKDGKIFFTGGILVSDLDKKPDVQGAETSTSKATCDTLKKSDAPSVTAFVVSQCPYGLQMQRVMKMAIAQEGQLAKSFVVRYIGSVENGKITSMHGDSEAQENLRQICIREEQQERYWPYVSCYMKEGKSQECVSQSAVNASQLTTCMSSGGKGISYAQKDFEMANTYKVSGSPTLVVNDQVVSEFDFGGRTNNALKDILCCSSSNKPGFCSKELSKENAATAFSPTDTGGDVSGAAAANCN